MRNAITNNAVIGAATHSRYGAPPGLVSAGWASAHSTRPFAAANGIASFQFAPAFFSSFQLVLQAVIPGGIQRIIRLGDVASLHVSREGICFVFAPGSLEQCLQLLRTVLAGVDLSDVAHEDFPPVFIYIAYQRYPGDSKHLSA